MGRERRGDGAGFIGELRRLAMAAEVAPHADPPATTNRAFGFKLMYAQHLLFNQIDIKNMVMVDVTVEPGCAGREFHRNDDACLGSDLTNKRRAALLWRDGVAAYLQSVKARVIVLRRKGVRDAALATVSLRVCMCVPTSSYACTNPAAG